MRHLGIIGFLCVCLGLISASLSALPAGGDVQINSDSPGTVQNEVRITLNPADASNLIAAYNDNIHALSSPLGISFSTDGGLSWSDRQLGIPKHPIFIPPTPDDGMQLPFIFDPFIDSDSQGNIYAGYIASLGGPGGPGGIYIERSTDKGNSWSGPTTIDFNLRAMGPMDPNYRFNDRSDMTVDSSDNVYAVWIKDVGLSVPTSDIYFSKSGPPGLPGPISPTGLDFTGAGPNSVAPQTVNDNPNGTDFANVPDVAVAANGTVYISWINVDVTDQNPKPGKLMFDRSTDGGSTFNVDIVAQNITALANHLSTAAGLKDDARSGSYPAIGVNPANSQTVYMVYAADPSGSDEADIFFTKTTDGGLNWSTPIIVNDDATNNDQFHPAIAVKPNGTIDVVWYDKRNSTNDDQWDVYFSQSNNGGASFSANIRITDQSFTSPTDLFGIEPWMGEYLGLDVDGSFAYIAFTSSLNDSKGDIFFDIQQNATTPPFDICLQDDSSSSRVLRWNSQTGDYIFCCGSTVITGKGTATRYGNIFKLTQNGTDRRLTAQMDASANRGNASLQMPPGRIICTIIDRDTRNDSCKCPGP